MSTRAQQQRGRDREFKVALQLDALGWLAIRAAGGPVDVLAVPALRALHPVFGLFGSVESLSATADQTEQGWRPLVVQVKSTAQGPYQKFRPEDRRVLLEMADRVAACAWLVWWPPHGVCTWIPSSDWPR